MVKQNIKPVEKTSHLRQEKTDQGTVDQHFFSSYHSLAVRCPACSNLMSSDFLSMPGECPNCHKGFKKSEALDAYLEARTIQVVYGGWTKEAWDRLENKRRSMEVGREKMREVSTSTKNMNAWSIREQEEHERRTRAERKLIDSLRNQSPVSSLRGDS